MKKKIIDGDAYYNQDCIDGSKKHLDEDSIDLIVTDPPYGIEGEKLHQHYNRNEDYTVDGYIEIPEEEYDQFSIDWVQEAERVLRPGGTIYIVSGYTNLYHILHALKQTELEEVNHLIWKYNFGVYTKNKYVSSHYHILYYQKPGGERIFNTYARYGQQEKDNEGGSLNYQDREDVWEINKDYKPGEKKNKNELPQKLLVKILQYSSNKEDLICDFFMGSFSTARVAKGLKRKFVGFEKSENIFSAGIEKMQKIQTGDLLDTLREPDTEKPENQNKLWTSEEKEQLQKRYNELIKTNLSKKKIVRKLGKEFGRGRFGIKRMLKKTNKNNTNTNFE